MDGAAVQPWEAWFPLLVSIGHYGVQLFFIISGFLLSLPFARYRLGLGMPPSLRTYFLRRLTRLEPPYIAAMLIMFCVVVVAFGSKEGLARRPNLLASLVYQHELVFGRGGLISIVAWSLEIEVQFYCLAPVLATVFSIQNAPWRRLLVLAVVVMVPVLRQMLPPHVADRVALTLPGQFEFFATGFLLTDFYLVSWKEKPARLLRWDLASALGWSLAIVLMVYQRYSLLRAPVLLIAYVGAFRGTISSRILAWGHDHRRNVLLNLPPALSCRLGGRSARVPYRVGRVLRTAAGGRAGCLCSGRPRCDRTLLPHTRATMHEPRLAKQARAAPVLAGGPPIGNCAVPWKGGSALMCRGRLDEETARMSIDWMTTTLANVSLPAEQQPRCLSDLFQHFEPHCVTPSNSA